jgi:hypothetical protein
MTRRLVDPDTAPEDFALRRLGVRTQRRTDTEVRHLQAYARPDPATAPPVVSGSRADGTALANLLAVLAQLGIVDDDTTA